ncbi:MAG: hypothetical protein HC817_14710 [Saprospiraceae bacterium]|nr:hypothetical protein [Saprospiraceae bacterium]
MKQYGYENSSNISLIGGFRYQRNNKGEILINPNNGVPLIDANFNPIGDRNPDFLLGNVNTFKLKDFNFSFTLDVRKGGDIFNGTALYLWENGLHPKQVDREKTVIYKGVLRDGLENSEKPTVNNIELSPYFNGSVYYRAIAPESFIEKDINWLRLRDVRLSYTFPSSLLKKINIFRSLSVYASATDLFFISNYSGADPNVNGLTAGVPGLNATGFDFGVMPTPVGYNFGLNIGF